MLLSRRFSSSSALSRFASFTSIPPYFDFQLYSVWSVTPGLVLWGQAFCYLLLSSEVNTGQALGPSVACWGL
jgi:hypothetical protein